MEEAGIRRSQRARRVGDYEHNEVRVLIDRPEMREGAVHVATVVERSGNPPVRVTWVVSADADNPHILDVIAKDEQEQHIAGQVEEIPVQECVGEILIKMRIARIKQQRIAPVSREKIHLRREGDNVGDDQRPIHVRRSPQRSVGTDGDEHFLGVTE